MKDHLDNGMNLKEKLTSLKTSDKALELGKLLSYKEIEAVMKVVSAHTQSKLKAFAGEVEKAIGEEIMCYDSTDISHKFMGCDTCQSNMKNHELRQALKAIKGKAGIE